MHPSAVVDRASRGLQAQSFVTSMQRLSTLAPGELIFVYNPMFAPLQNITRPHFSEVKPPPIEPHRTATDSSSSTGIQTHTKKQLQSQHSAPSPHARSSGTPLLLLRRLTCSMLYHQLSPKRQSCGQGVLAHFFTSRVEPQLHWRFYALCPANEIRPA